MSFGFDALGRNTSQGGPLGTMGYGYDAAGRRIQLSWPNSAYVTYTYQVTGEVTAIKESGTTALATYAYDDLGMRTSVTLGNGTVTSYGFDNVSRLASLGLNLDGSGTARDVTTSFGYSPASQIASQTRNNDAYAWGGHANAARSYTSNGLNQLTAAGGTSLGHDARGNLTSSGSDSFGYSSENLLTGATMGGTGSTLTYDPALRLYQFAAGSTVRFQYDGTDLVAEYNGSSVLQKRYVHGPGADEVLVEYDAAGNKTYLHADERGSIVARSNGSGTTTGVNSYDEYGTPAAGNSGRFQYTGQAWLGEIGLSYYKARFYAPSLGRFVQTDPIGYDDGLNWYAYAGNDPVNSTDPTGLDDITVRGRRKARASSGGILGVINRAGAGAGAAAAGEIAAEVVDDVGLVVTGMRPIQGGEGVELFRDGHFYDTTEKICRAPLDVTTMGAINRATAVPDGTINPSRTDGTYPVGGWVFGIIPTIAGYVTTRFSADGTSATNTTTAVHMFVGTIDRIIYSDTNGTYIRTIGRGNAGSDPIGSLRDEFNQSMGPGIFREANSLARRVAKRFNSSC